MKPESCIKEITGEIKLDFAKELREFQGDLKDFGKKQNDFLWALRQEKCERQQWKHWEDGQGREAQMNSGGNNKNSETRAERNLKEYLENKLKSIKRQKLDDK